MSIYNDYLKFEKEIDLINNSISTLTSNINLIVAKETDENQQLLAELLEEKEGLLKDVKKLERYRDISRDHITIIPTSERISPKEPNLMELTALAINIVDYSKNDQNAACLYNLVLQGLAFYQTKIDIIDKKAGEISKRNAETRLNCDVIQLESKIKLLEEELISLTRTEAFYSLCYAITNKYNHIDSKTYHSPEFKPKEIAIGNIVCPLYLINKEAIYNAKLLLKKKMDEKNNTLEIPFEVSFENYFKLDITFDTHSEMRAIRQAQQIIFNFLSLYPANKCHGLVLDPVRMNASVLGKLMEMQGEENSFLIQSPTNQSELTKKLSRFLDYVIQNSIIQDPIDCFLVIFGFPELFPSEMIDIIRRICVNYQLYHTNVIFVRNADDCHTSFGVSVLHNILLDTVSILFSGVSNTSLVVQGKIYSYRESTDVEDVADSFIKEAALAYTPKTLGVKYTDRFSFAEIPVYTKGRKNISLPYAVDADDRVHDCVLDGMSFAAYLVGSAGSGKSTLIHNLILGVLRDFHPDDVELWLADFKKTEFSFYIKNLPPHVKYVLLDESPELIYEFIDKIESELFHREAVFSSNGWKDISEVPVTVYMPKILIIIDEFSLMSQVIYDTVITSGTVDYRVKMQNILAIGRALGFRFLFSSQKMTQDIRGLTSTAKEQIQLRLAMKSSTAEIKEVLDVQSYSLTDQYKHWIEVLPKYHLLVRSQVTTDEIALERLQVMYIPAENEKDYSSFIQTLRMKISASTTYNCSQADSYFDKHPIVVDGNEVISFDTVMKQVKNYSLPNSIRDFIEEGDKLLYIGLPRLIERFKPIILTRSYRQNLLFFYTKYEIEHSISTLLSIEKCFKMQGGSVVLLGSADNRFYKVVRKRLSGEFQEVFDVKDSLRFLLDTKQAIRNRIESSKLLILIGVNDMAEQLIYDTQMNETSFGKGNPDIKPIDLLQAIEQTERGVPFASVKKAYNESSEAVENQISNIDEFNDVMKYILLQGAKVGYHSLLAYENVQEFKDSRISRDAFDHVITFALDRESSSAVLHNRAAENLPAHVSLYSGVDDMFSLHPYLHKEVLFRGWRVNEEGEAVKDKDIVY